MGIAWRSLIIAILCLALSAPASANRLQTAADEIVVGIVVVSVGLAVLVTVLVLHHKNKRAAMTGCITSSASGMSITDDRNKRSLALSGNLAGLKAGERMTLEGKRHKGKNGEAVFEARSTIKDLGACAP